MTIEELPDHNAFLASLQEMLDACGPEVNRHGRAKILIDACLDEGIDTRSGIIGVLKVLGFDYRHVSIVLNYETGNNPERDRWRQGPGGTYRRHDRESEQDRAA